MRKADFKKLVAYFKKCKVKVGWVPEGYATQEWDDKETIITFNLALTVAEHICHEYYHRHIPRKFRTERAEEQWVNRMADKHFFSAPQATTLFRMFLHRAKDSEEEE